MKVLINRCIDEMDTLIGSDRSYKTNLIRSKEKQSREIIRIRGNYGKENAIAKSIRIFRVLKLQIIYLLIGFEWGLTGVLSAEEGQTGVDARGALVNGELPAARSARL